MLGLRLTASIAIACLVGCGDAGPARNPPRVVEPPQPMDDEPDPPDAPIDPPPAVVPIAPTILPDGTQRFDLPRYVPGSPDAPDGAVLGADGFYEVTVLPEYAQIDDSAVVASFALCTSYGIEVTRIVITIGDCDEYPLDFFRVNEDDTFTFAYGQFEEGNGFFYSEARIRWEVDP